MIHNTPAGKRCDHCDCRHCSCSHHLAIPVLVILIGLVFMFGAEGFMRASTVAVIWPMLLILAGIVKILERDCDCC